MDTEKWLGETRRAIKVGSGGLAINIKKDISEALGIQAGSLVEVRYRNTGMFAKPDPRRKKKDVEPGYDGELDKPEQPKEEPEELI